MAASADHTPDGTTDRVESSAKKARQSSRGADRRRQLLDAAASLFSTFGYTGTSMRDIAAEAGILSGSVYYHFKSKDELLLAVHEEGVSNILNKVNEALAAGGGDPWDRLEAACIGHLEALLAGSAYAQVVTPEFPRRFPEDLRRQMIQQRNAYEIVFRDLVADIPLPARIDRRLLRLGLMGSLNWSLTWYRPNQGATPAQIARQFVNHYRLGLDPRSA